jgi:hypothetical protein
VVWEIEIVKFVLFFASFFVNVVLPTPEGEDNTNIIPCLFITILKIDQLDVFLKLQKSLLRLSALKHKRTKARRNKWKRLLLY